MVLHRSGQNVREQVGMRVGKRFHGDIMYLPALLQAGLDFHLQAFAKAAGLVLVIDCENFKRFFHFNYLCSNLA